MNTTGSVRKNKRVFWILMMIVILIGCLGSIAYLLFIGADKKLAEHRQRGNEYLMKDDYRGAREEFLKALELEPENLVVYVQLAEACIGLEDYREAADFLEQALVIAEEGEAAPEQYEVLVNKLAECYRNSGEEGKREGLLKQNFR